MRSGNAPSVPLKLTSVVIVVVKDVVCASEGRAAVASKKIESKKMLVIIFDRLALPAPLLFCAATAVSPAVRSFGIEILSQYKVGEPAKLSPRLRDGGSSLDWANAPLVDLNVC